MAMAEPPSSCSFLPLLEPLEDSVAGQSEQTDAYLTIASRLSGEEARKFLPAVEHYFARLGKATLGHITSPNVELSQAALQALGFCVYHSRVVSGVSEILSALCSLVVKSTDKNTCTRALWVISKQSFPPDMVVSSILDTLESVWSREDIQFVVMEHEALNVIIRMLEQVPTQMGDAAVQWVKLVIPLVVHSAAKVRLRAAATMEMGMPLLLEKQTEVAAIIEPMMSLKLIPELQKLFMSKNETNVLKLWPLFVKLLGKLLHKGGPFINSLLHLEELGFRSSSPSIKKMTFIAWKSLIDNFALNPEILCSSKRMKLLMQPLTSINVRTEVLMLTKVEVWWYLVVQLGPNLSPYFDQVSVPLLKCTIGSDSSSVPGTPSRAVSQNGAAIPGTPGFNSPPNMARMSLNSSIQIPSIFPTIQLLGLEMLLHYFLGPEITAKAAKNNFTLSLEPLNHPLLSSASSFTKHATVLTSYIRHGLINIGKDAPESLLGTLWTSLVHFVNITIESGDKKERYGCEPLTLMLQALQSIVTSETMPVDKVLILIKATVKGIPQRVLGSASYQVGKMDVLNGTPALFLILLLYKSNLLEAYIEDKRFFQCLQTLVSCGLSGPTSHLAFAEAVMGAINRSAGSLQNKEQLWVMWSTVVCPLTDTIMQSNEVNQGDALEHNFSSIYAALLFPITHLLCGTPLQQVTQKLMLTTWSKLYRVFARCSALVITAEENICCEELCVKLTAAIEREALMVPSTLAAIVNILQVIVECVDFSPYTPLFQQKLKSPHTPVNWMPKRNKVLGNLTTFQGLLVQCLEVYLDGFYTSSEATGMTLISILSTLFTNFALTNIVKEALTSLIQPLTLFYKQATNELPSFTSQLLEKLEKLLGDILSCLQTCTALVYDDELLVLLSPLLVVLFPHKHKQLHTLVTQFWNSTFANSVSLIYPDEIRSILIQVKQKTPIILPGFDLVSMPDELSGQCSSESSQLETKLSGTSVSSMGKRNSLLTKASDLKEKSSVKTSKPVSAKLDFGSPKPPRREVLEEEASIDFVFIPPETKERVLTEHQKEVKRTKRVDIPAMYNSLDASLDTTVFTQYTQSQQDYFKEATPLQGKHQRRIDILQKVQRLDFIIKTTQNYASLMTAENKKNDQDMISESAGISVKDVKSNERVEDVGFQYKKETSPNSSCSSELISGTSQKPNSRRQSFITLEKYSEGKTTNPGQEQITNSQEHTDKYYSSLVSPTLIGPNSKDSLYLQTRKGNCLCSGNYAPKSPLRLKESGTECKQVTLTERMPSDATEDVSALKDFNPSCQEEVSQLDNSQSSMTQTPGEPRRSGRYRVKPLLPGEDTEVREEKYIHFKRRHSREELKGNSPKPSIVQNRPKTRSRQAGEEVNSKDRLRTRAQKDQSESSQKNSQGQSHKIKQYSSSGLFLDNLEPKNRSTRESSQSDLWPDTQSDSKSKSKGRPSWRSKASLTTKEDNEIKNNVLAANEDIRQTATLEFTEHTNKNNEPKKDAQLITSSPQTNNTQEFDFAEQTENCNEKPKRDSQLTTCSTQIGWPSQEFEDYKKVINENDSQAVTSPSNDNSLHINSLTNRLINESEFRDKEKTIQSANENISQENSEVTYSSSDGQFLRRSRRKKTLSEAVGSEEKGKNKDSSERRSRSNSQSVMLGICHIETTFGDSTRNYKAQEVKTSSSTSSPLSNQEIAGSVELSQGKGRYSRRRSSQAIVTNVGSSESESSEPRENLPIPKQRGRKPRASLHSPLTLKSTDKMNNEIVKHDYTSRKTNDQCIEKKDAMKLNDSQKTQDLQGSGLFKLMQNTEGQSIEDSHPDIEFATVLEKTDKITNKSYMYGGSLQEEKQRQKDLDNTVLHETDTRDIQTAEKFESVGISAEETKERLPCDLSWLSAEGRVLSCSIETTESLHSSDEKTDVYELSDTVAEKQNIDSDYQEYPVVPMEVRVVVSQNTSLGENEIECLNAIDDFSKEEEQFTSIKEGNAQNQHSEASDKLTPLQETDKDSVIQTMECQGDDETWTTNTEKDLDPKLSVCNAPVLPKSMCKQAVQGSPLKQVDQDSVIGPDVIQSPCSNKTRGPWSPLASPSTSILKKGQKRPLEDETPSPIVKSRRVSFADPIQQQEIADDIDRRSPAIRTSSPRRSKNSNYVTTPTKGLLSLRPRNLHSPGYKSSKKCLISEMSQEQRPVYRDCIYPALVGCSAPVEAVLPQISSNMGSRGFGQLIRARNIKTVGDISALTISEIKTLPFRSPKISNVKKALKTYEQQLKGQDVDELKSFDETEMITSELARVPQNKDEEDKTSGGTQDWRLEQDGNSGNETVNQLAREQRPKGQLHSEGLIPQLETLTYRMTPLQLSYCSAEQLVRMYDTLGSMMKSVVVELQTRLCQTDGKP
uniref:Telomere-associated protein Rif1 N-terminal domain-containing protein n=1 Tax=Mola mola TaxID=94237 RepID=A0A3Q3VYT2_MOLML